MNSKSADVLKAIPDFEQFMSLAGEISKLSFRKMQLETAIKSKESETFKTVSTKEDFFQNGKPPSATYIENAYKYAGVEGEILPLRNELSEVTAKLDEKRIQFDIYKTMVDIWRSLSSSERSTSI